MIINIQHIKWTHPYIIYGYILCIQNIYDDELNNCCHDTTLKWAADPLHSRESHQCHVLCALEPLASVSAKLRN